MKQENDANQVIDNLEKLQEEVKMAGFDSYFSKELEQKIAGGETDFSLSKSVDINSDKMQYQLHFRIDPETRKGYFNDMDTALQIAGSEQQRTHTFPRFQKITAKEAFHLLKYGEQTAVHKKLFNKEGEPYQAWLSLDVNAPKDQYGNYPVNSYHENYYKKQPFDLRQSLEQLPLPVKELEQPQNNQVIESLLKKGAPVEVTVMHEGEEKKALLSVNAKVGRIEIYDTKMQPLIGQQQADEIKKKPDQQQRTPWQDRKLKGQRPGL